MTDSKIQALADKLFPVTTDETEQREIKNIPPEQRRLHTEMADLTVGSIRQMLTNGKIEIPEFQRKYVWSRSQASRLIESLVIQCPIPVIYLSQTSSGVLQVIDGNQRLSAINLFLSDAFPLQGLTTYPELNDYSWSELDPRFRDHILNRTLRCITILKDTHPQIKFDVFERLNTGSVKLSPQEIRHGLNYGKLMDGIDELTKLEAWKLLSGTKADKRMRSAELILRFFALKQRRERYEKPLSAFLDSFSSDFKNIDEKMISEWKAQFVETLRCVEYYFGKNSFKQLDRTGVSVGNFNAAIYDCQMIGIAESSSRDLKYLLKDKASVVRGFSALFSDHDFLTSIQRATSDEGAVKQRIEKSVSFFNAV